MQHTLNSDFELSLIALSLFIAVFVAYACIEFSRCITLVPSKKQKDWILGGAIVLGFGLWSSQLASLYALRLPVEIQYLTRPAIMSLLIAILCAAIVLYINTQESLNNKRLATVSMGVGLLMTGMNFMGLKTFQVPANIFHSNSVILVSALFVIIATAIVAYETFTLRNKKSQPEIKIHIIAMLAGISLVVSYLLSIFSLTFSTTDPISQTIIEDNINSYQVLIVSSFAIFLLWASVIFSRWRAKEGIKFSSRIAGLAFGLVLITAGTIGTITFTTSKKVLTQQQLASRLTKLELEATQLQRIIDSFLQDALVLSRTPPILGIMRAQNNNGADEIDHSSDKEWQNRLTEIFKGFLQSKPTYLQTAYISATNKGKAIVSLKRQGQNIHRSSDYPLNKKVKETILSRAKINHNYQAFLTSINSNSGHREPTILHASVPIKTPSGELFGVLVIDLDFSSVLNTTLQKMNTAHYLINPDGDVIYGSPMSGSKSSSHSTIFDILTIYPALGSIINNPRKITGNLMYSEAPEPLYLNYRKIQLDQDQTQYYLRITTTPFKNISSHILTTLNKFSTVVLILIGMSALFAALLSRIITRPLKQMTLAAKQFANGNITTQLPKSAAGEFGILARAFDEMITKVDERGKVITQNENFVKNIVNSAADGLLTVDEKGTIHTFNDSAQSIFSYDKSKVIGKNITILMPERFRGGHNDLLENYTSTPASDIKPLRAKITGLRSNGEEFPAELSINRVSSSETPLFIGIVRDITLREKSAINLRLVNKVLESTPEGIIITDKDGTIVRTNPAFEEITGFSEDQVIGQTPGVLKSGRHNKDFFKHMWQSIINHGLWQGEIWDKRKNGEIYPKWLNISAIKDDDGNTTHYVGLFSDITERKEVEKRLEHLAHYDALTGLPNRALFHDRLLHSLEFARRADKGLAVMMLDLDRFKIINDTLGHDIGDLLLIEAAKRLQNCLRKVDTVARMGGDEFTIILSDLSDASDTIQLAKVIIDMMSKPFSLSGHDCFVGVSIGISSFPADGNNPKTLIKNADAAMYRAKELGRNTYQLFNASMNEQNAQRLNIETKLRTALQNNELEIYYQPQIDLHSGSTSGMEALLRWHHDEIGMISPEVFIPIAEESGLITDIGRWILRTACQQYKTWSESGLPDISIMVNLSAQQILQPSLAEFLRELLASSDMPAHRLILEISESTLLDFPAHAISILEKLSELGVLLAIDDFGTSYSSMGQLKSMPIHSIKIDKSFVQNINDGSNNEEIIKAIIAMARNLNLQVVAEGVETMEQLAFLKLEGCGAMQGYLYSPPLPLKAISHMLKNGVAPTLFGSPVPHKL